MKKIQPIEKYLAEQTKKGYSLKDVHDILAKAGYCEEEIAIALKSHSQHHMIISLLIACMVLTLVASVVFIRTQSHVRYVAVPPLYISPEATTLIPQAHMTSIAEPCVKGSAEQRDACLSDALKRLPAVYENDTQFGDPNYPVYVQDVALIAALKGDDSICDILPEHVKPQCVSSLPYLRAIVGGQSDACYSFADDVEFLRCYTKSLSANDEARYKDFALRLDTAINSSSASGDFSACDRLESTRISGICKDSAIFIQSIDMNDVSICERIANSLSRDQCKMAVVQPQVVQGVDAAW